MPKNKIGSNTKLIHSIRILVAIFALLLAAGHLMYAAMLGSGGAGSVSSGHSAPTFNAIGFWFAVETIAYTIIVLIFLLGLKPWYIPSVIFGAFNIAIYFVSGVAPIPGVAGSAFPSRFIFSGGLSTINIIVASWLIFVILGIILIKYDQGSELDKLLFKKK